MPQPGARAFCSLPGAGGERFRRSGGLPPQANSFLPSADGGAFRRYSGAPLEASFTPSEGVDSGRLRRPGDAGSPARGIVGAHRQGQKGTGHRMVSCPLLTPLTFLGPLSKAFAAKRGLRGLGSGRLGAYGTLCRPEVTLRYLAAHNSARPDGAGRLFGAAKR